MILDLKPEFCLTCEEPFKGLSHVHIYRETMVCTECKDAFEARDNMLQGRISWVEHLRYCMSINYKTKG